MRAAVGADLVHRIEHRHPRGRLEFVGEVRRSRRVSVVPLREERQAIRDVLLCEERGGCDLRWLLLHSQTTSDHDNRLLDDDQAGRMLLAEEVCQAGGHLEADEAAARRSPRVEIVRLRADGFTDAARQYRASDSDEGVLAERPRHARRFFSRLRCLTLRPALATARPSSEVPVRRLTL